MLEIDGTAGEGGGQILRSSLTLSMLTGKPFRITRIRGGRRKPGLLRQHLTAVRAAAQICGADVEGDGLRSDALSFVPGPVRSGDYRFAIGTAGSTSLVLQTVLLPLALAAKRSTVEVTGGTHNGMSPPAHFLSRVFLPALERLGVHTAFELHRYGFYPAGGGRVSVVVEPCHSLGSVALDGSRGEITDLVATAVVSDLPRRVAHRELSVLRDRLGLHRKAGTLHTVKDPIGPGNAVWVEARTPVITELFSAVGQKGVRSEDVADGVADAFVAWRDSGAVVGAHLADQLLIPMALAGGSMSTTRPSLHTQTNLDVVATFLGTRLACERVGDDRWRVRRP